jgi:four helix bundle protein
MEYQFTFEKLEVWDLAKNIAVSIYKITQTFPIKERHGIIPQINRAAISIPANIAEGSARLTAKDQSRFYSIAYSSTMELLSHLLISLELQFISKSIFDELKTNIRELSNKLNALIKYKRAKFK